MFPHAANPVWEMAGDAAGARLAGSISVNRDLTAAALVRLITGASVFWLALQLCRDAGRARSLVTAIALIGAVYAAYGLIAAKTGWLRLPDMPQGGPASRHSCRRPLSTPIPTRPMPGSGSSRRSESSSGSAGAYGVFAYGTPRRQLAALVETIGRDGAPVLAGGFTILTALLLTGSRGGIAASVLAIIAFVAARPARRRTRTAIMADVDPGLILGLVLVAGTGLLFGTALADKIARRRFFRSEPARDLSPDLAVDRRSALAGLGLWHVCRCISDVSRRLDRRIGYLEPGAQYLSRSGAGIGYRLRVDLRSRLSRCWFSAASEAPRRAARTRRRRGRGRRRRSRRRARACRFQHADPSRRPDRRGAARCRSGASGKLAGFSR